MPRLAIILSHPVQYYSPWFRHLAAAAVAELRVFYLWNGGVTAQLDNGFGHPVQWDLPLLDGYDHEFVPNLSAAPGTHHFRGLHNPELIPRLLAWRPEVVLMFGYAYQSHLRVLLSRNLRPVPVVFRGDSHELAGSGEGLKPAVGRVARRILFRRFRAALAVGRANQRYLQGSGFAPEAIHFVPHCVENERFRAAAPEARAAARAWRLELGIAEDAFVILFVGKFEAKKQPVQLVTAFREFLKSAAAPGASRVVLLLVGAGALEAEIRAAAGGELGRSVFLAPFQNQTAMPKVYAAGNVIVLPSLGRQETWGLVINEAMNLGIPAIVSSHVGCGPDLVRDGETGWVYPAGDVTALAHCLRAAAGNPEQCREFGRAAYELIDHYSYRAATSALKKALEKIRPDDRAGTGQ